MLSSHINIFPFTFVFKHYQSNVVQDDFAAKLECGTWAFAPAFLFITLGGDTGRSGGETRLARVKARRLLKGSP